MSRNTYYRICPDCGAHLDPDESCECRKTAIPLYLCDREACSPCNNKECYHTANILHAINFERAPGTNVYSEKR